MRALQSTLRVMGMAALAACLVQFLACDRASAPSTPADGASRRAYAANPALASMVRTLAGDAIEVVTPWDATEGDPAFWKPSPDDIRSMQSCEAIFLNGAGYEPWAQQAALPRARVVDTTAGVRSKFIEEAGISHSHGPAGEHSHSSIASTTWLSPELAKAQLAAIEARLAQVLAGMVDRDELSRRGDAVRAALDRAAAELAAIAARESTWLASHPVYQYVGQAGGLAITSMHWEPGEMPPDTEWTKFRLLRAGQPRPRAWMLWEDEPGDDIRARLAEEGVEVAVLPLFPEVDGRFADGFATVLEEIRAALDAR